MKLRNLFYLLLALPLVFAACENLGGDEAKDPKLTVSTTVKSFEADGGVGYISYTLANAPADAQVTATCDAEWITNLTVNTKISFDVAENTTPEARETKIVVSYEAQVFEVPVEQAGADVILAPKFELDSIDTLYFPTGEGSGSVRFILENPIQDIEVKAVSDKEWLTISTISITETEGTIDFFITANEGEERQATITATYGELDPIVVTVIQAKYIDPNAVIEFVVDDCKAEAKDGGLRWDVIFTENDEVNGPKFTRISFALAKANTQRITDGTYSVEDGTILRNSSSFNGFSEYRYNVSDEQADIVEGTFEVTTDTQAKTISIEGLFTAGDREPKIVEIKYTGEMKGMDLTEAVSGAIEYNEWASVYKQYEGVGELMFFAISADNALTMRFTVKHSGNSKLLPAGTYNVEPFEMGKKDYMHDCKATYNSVEANLTSGSATFEHISGGFKIILDVTDDMGRQFTGTYEGSIVGATNPA